MQVLTIESESDFKTRIMAILECISSASDERITIDIHNWVHTNSDCYIWIFDYRSWDANDNPMKKLRVKFSENEKERLHKFIDLFQKEIMLHIEINELLDGLSKS